MSRLMIVEVPSYSSEFKGIREVCELVRCQECKYWRNKDSQQIPTASIMCGHMHPDDFCSYGEPKEKLKGSERLVKGSERSSE